MLFLQHGRWAQTNMLSTFFATLAIFLFYRGYQDSEKRTVSYLLMYAAVGLGVLTMGPMNLAIPAVVIFWYLVVIKDFKHIKELRLEWGIPIFLLITLPWYVLVSLQDGYAFDLLIKTNVSRYFDTWAHPRPFYYYLLGLPWAFAPWSLYLPGALHLAFSNRSKEDRKALKFLLVWIISLFLFFSFAKGKRPQYILSIYPALALLIGYLGNRAMLFWQDKYYQRAINIPSLILLSIAALVTVALPVGTGIYFKPAFGIALGASALIGTFAVLIGIAWRKKQARQLLFLPAAFMFVFTVYGVHFLIPKLEEYKSPRPFCQKIVERLEKGADWAMYKFYRAAYVYYTDSFAKILTTEEELNRFLDLPTQSIVAMREKEYKHLKEPLKKKMVVITQRKIGHRAMVLISNQKE